MADSPQLPTGYRLLAFDTLDSTNKEALRRIDSIAESGDVVWSKRQTAGRGRRGREWVSTDGNLFLTLIVRIPEECMIGQLAFVTALGVADALVRAMNDPPNIRLKWPNDILLDGHKLGGILIERSDSPRNVDLIAIGIGINVAEAAFPGSASMRNSGCTASLSVLVGLLCQEFDKWQKCWLESGFATVRDAWMARADRMGEHIKVQFPDGTSVEGTFHGIDETGALELRRAEGPCEIIATGEVFFPTA